MKTTILFAATLTTTTGALCGPILDYAESGYAAAEEHPTWTVTDCQQAADDAAEDALATGLYTQGEANALGAAYEAGCVLSLSGHAEEHLNSLLEVTTYCGAP